MFTGHAALALALKARVPKAHFVPLVLACYGPDFVDVALMIPHPRSGMSLYSHSVPAVVVGALLASLAYRFLANAPGAKWLFVGWLLHWPLDFMTGLKPVFSLDNLLGLDLYHLAVADFVLESMVIIAACMAFERAFVRSTRQSRIVRILGVLLICGQLAFVLTVSTIDGLKWNPSLALPR